MDEGWRMQKTTPENDREPEQEPSCEKDEYETKCTSIIELVLQTTRVIDLSNFYYCVLMTFTYSWFCFQIEKRRYRRDL